MAGRGRSAAFAQIAEHLREMRRTGAQPVVVALQEAFTTSAKQIGEAAGYRYIVKGPSAADRSVIAMTATDRKFASGASWLPLVPVHVFVPFGTEADGTMLSDHIGYSVRYNFVHRA